MMSRPITTLNGKTRIFHSSWTYNMYNHYPDPEPNPHPNFQVVCHTGLPRDMRRAAEVMQAVRDRYGHLIHVREKVLSVRVLVVSCAGVFVCYLCGTHFVAPSGRIFFSVRTFLKAQRTNSPKNFPTPCSLVSRCFFVLSVAGSPRGSA